MPDDNRSARSIFLQAVEEIPRSEWDHFVSQECGDDIDLQKKVKALLHAHSELGPTAEPAESSSDSDFLAPTREMNSSEGVGTQFGNYKLLQEIGQGGFGVVYMAEQKRPVRRKIALKIIKPGMDTRQVIARFEAERQALAMMDHPNIARVLDAGMTETGRPYFVMELVKGIPITEYCDSHRLTTRQRLDLFIPVCRGIQHAHQKGVIHRDIKPSNILVAEFDEHPIPKIIDFGIAKAIGQELTDKTVFTAYGQIIGTLDYMSPEQAKFNQLDVDTRSDVYSLGVLLYELLVGETPFDRNRLRMAALEEIIRIIREEEPPCPSLRLQSSTTLPSIAANRGSEPRRLMISLRGELDWIVMRAMEKERSRRYESAGSLASDIQHYLNDEPVVARPASMGYRTKKFVRRYKALVAISTSGLLVLIAVMVASLLAAGRFRTLAIEKAELVEIKEDALRTANQEKKQADAARVQETVHRKIAERALARSEEDHRLAQRHLHASQMVQAFRTHQDHLMVPGQRILDRLVPEEVGDDMRSFGWYLLWNKWNPDRAWGRGDTLPLLEDRMNYDAPHCVFHPDGKRVFVSQEMPASIQLRDLQSNVILREFSRRGPGFLSIALSPDGRWLAAGSHYEVLVWDLNADRGPITLRGHALVVFGLAFSPDGTLLASASSGGYGDKGRKGELKVWNTSDFSQRYSLSRHRTGINGVAFSPDGKELASAGFDNQLLVCDAMTGEELDYPQLQARTQVAYSPDGRYLVSVAGDSLNRSNIYDRQRKEQVDVQLPGVSIAYSADGNLIATGQTNGNVHLYDGRTFEQIDVLSGNTDFVNCVQFSPDSKQLISCSNITCVWELRDRIGKWTPQAHADATVFGPWWELRNVAAISPDKSLVAIATGKDEVSVFDFRSGQKTFTVKHESGVINGIEFSHSGTLMATAARDGVLLITNTANGETEWRSTERKAYRDVSFSHDDKWVAAAGHSIVDIWDVASGTHHMQPSLEYGAVSDIEFAPGGHRLLIATLTDFNYQGSRRPGRLMLYDLTSSSWVWSRSWTQHVFSATFSPHGDMILAGDGDWFSRAEPGQATLWETESGQRIATFEGHSGNVARVAYHPDGKTVATASMSEIRLWDPEIQQEKGRIPWDGESINGLFFSADGKTLFATTVTGKVRYWNAATESDVMSFEPTKWAQRAKKHIASRQFTEAVADYSKAIYFDADRSDWLAARGLAHAELKNWPEAESDLNRAATLDPDDFFVHRDLALVELAQQRYQEYGQTCAEMLRRFNNEQHAGTLTELASIVTRHPIRTALSPEDLSRLKQLIQSAERSGERQIAIASIEFRFGDQSFVPQELLEFPESDSADQTRVERARLLSLLEHGRGHSTESQRWRDVARTILAADDDWRNQVRLSCFENELQDDTSERFGDPIVAMVPVAKDWFAGARVLASESQYLAAAQAYLEALDHDLDQVPIVEIEQIIAVGSQLQKEPKTRVRSIRLYCLADVLLSRHTGTNAYRVDLWNHRHVVCQYLNAEQLREILSVIESGEQRDGLRNQFDQILLATFLRAMERNRFYAKAFGEADEFGRRCLSIKESIFADSPDDLIAELDLAWTRMTLGKTWWELDRLPEAHAIWQRTLADLRTISEKVRQVEGPAQSTKLMPVSQFMGFVCELEAQICDYYGRSGLWEFASEYSYRNIKSMRIYDPERDGRMAITAMDRVSDEEWNEYARKFTAAVRERNDRASLRGMGYILRTIGVNGATTKETLTSTFDDARTLVEKAPDDSWYHSVLALVQHRMGENQVALQSLAKDESDRSSSGRWLDHTYLAALIQLGLGDTTDASELFRDTASELFRIAERDYRRIALGVAGDDRRFPMPINNTWWGLLTAQEIRKELEQKLVSHPSDDLWGCLIRARGYNAVGEKGRARAELETIEKSDAASIELAVAVTELKIRWDGIEKAEHHWSGLIEKTDRNPQAIFACAVWWYRRGDQEHCQKRLSDLAARLAGSKGSTLDPPLVTTDDERKLAGNMLISVAEKTDGGESGVKLLTDLGSLAAEFSPFPAEIAGSIRQLGVDIREKGAGDAGLDVMSVAADSFRKAVAEEPDHLFLPCELAVTLVWMSYAESDPQRKENLLGEADRVLDANIVHCSATSGRKVEHAFALKMKGEAAQARADWQTAVRYFEESLKLSTNDVWTYIGLLNSYVNVSSLDEEVVTLHVSNALAKHGQFLDMTSKARSIAMRLHDAGAFQAADQIAARIVASNPEFAWIFATRADWAEKRDDFNEALNEINRAIEIEPNQFWFFFSKAYYLLRLDKKQEALDVCDAGLRLAPGNPTGVLRRADICLALGNVEVALVESSTALAKQPDRDWAWRVFTQAAIRSRDVEKIHRAFQVLEQQWGEQKIVLEDRLLNRSKLWRPFGIALIAHGDSQRYRQFANQLIESKAAIDDENEIVRLVDYLSLASQALDDWEPAISILARLGQDQHHRVRARLLARAGRHDAAAQAMHQVDARLTDPMDLLWLSLIENGRGNTGEAKEHLQAAAEIITQNPALDQDPRFALLHSELKKLFNQPED